MTLAWTDDKLSSGQAQNEVKFDFQVKFDLEGQGRSPFKIIGTLIKVFCICVPNLVILAWRGDELWSRQTRDWHTDRQTDTHTHTDEGNDNTRRPKLASGKNSWVAGNLKRDTPSLIYILTIVLNCVMLTHWPLAPGKCGCNLKLEIIDRWSTRIPNVLTAKIQTTCVTLTFTYWTGNCMWCMSLRGLYLCHISEWNLYT